MQAKHRARPGRSVLAMIAGVTMLAACSTNTGLVSDRWFFGASESCERLTVGWPVTVAVLQDIVGTHVTPRDTDADGQGELRLSILRCGAPASSAAPMLLAQVTIPLAADSMPIMVTSVAEDGWSSLPLTVVDRGSNRRSATSGPFSQHGYAVMDAALAFNAAPSGDATLVTAELQFEEGRIVVNAATLDQVGRHETTTALVGTDSDDYVVSLGGETARRHSSVRATVRIEGSTVLSDLGLAATPATAVFDTDLASERLLWSERLTSR